MLGGFDLRKWHSNSNELLKLIDDYEETFFGNTTVGRCSEECKAFKTLGIVWDEQSDNFIFNLEETIKEALQYDVITKRLVLQTLATFFDPLGVLSPAILLLKLLFQEVCRMKCNWDEQLPSDFVTKWKQVLTSLLRVKSVTLARHYLLSNNIM